MPKEFAKMNKYFQILGLFLVILNDISDAQLENRRLDITKVVRNSCQTTNDCRRICFTPKYFSGICEYGNCYCISREHPKVPIEKKCNAEGCTWRYSLGKSFCEGKNKHNPCKYHCKRWFYAREYECNPTDNWCTCVQFRGKSWKTEIPKYPPVKIFRSSCKGSPKNCDKQCKSQKTAKIGVCISNDCYCTKSREETKPIRHCVRQFCENVYQLGENLCNMTSKSGCLGVCAHVFKTKHYECHREKMLCDCVVPIKEELIVANIQKQKESIPEEVLDELCRDRTPETSTESTTIKPTTKRTTMKPTTKRTTKKPTTKRTTMEPITERQFAINIFTIKPKFLEKTTMPDLSYLREMSTKPTIMRINLPDNPEENCDTACKEVYGDSLVNAVPGKDICFCVTTEFFNATKICYDGKCQKYPNFGKDNCAIPDDLQVCIQICEMYFFVNRLECDNVTGCCYCVVDVENGPISPKDRVVRVPETCKEIKYPNICEENKDYTYCSRVCQENLSFKTKYSYCNEEGDCFCMNKKGRIKPNFDKPENDSSECVPTPISIGEICTDGKAGACAALCLKEYNSKKIHCGEDSLCKCVPSPDKVLEDVFMPSRMIVLRDKKIKDESQCEQQCKDQLSEDFFERYYQQGNNSQCVCYSKINRVEEADNSDCDEGIITVQILPVSERGCNFGDACKVFCELDYNTSEFICDDKRGCLCLYTNRPTTTTPTTTTEIPELDRAFPVDETCQTEYDCFKICKTRSRSKIKQAHCDDKVCNCLQVEGFIKPDFSPCEKECITCIQPIRLGPICEGDKLEACIEFCTEEYDSKHVECVDNSYCNCIAKQDEQGENNVDRVVAYKGYKIRDEAQCKSRCSKALKEDLKSHYFLEIKDICYCLRISERIDIDGASCTKNSKCVQIISTGVFACTYKVACHAFCKMEYNTEKYKCQNGDHCNCMVEIEN